MMEVFYNKYELVGKGVCKIIQVGRGIITVGVTDLSSGFVTVKFDSVGSKTLSLKFAPLTIVEG